MSCGIGCRCGSVPCGCGVGRWLQLRLEPPFAVGAALKRQKTKKRKKRKDKPPPPRSLAVEASIYRGLTLCKSLLGSFLGFLPLPFTTTLGGREIVTDEGRKAQRGDGTC